MSKKDLLEKRKALKARKPSFRRHDSHKNPKLSSSWRRPKGLQNKLRLKKRGYGIPVSTGWGSPNEVKGLHPSGLEPVVVNNVSELAGLDSKTQGAIIGKRVGDRKRLAMIEEAEKNSITILNFDAKKKADDIKSKRKAQKEQRQKIEEKRKKEEKAAKKKEAEEKAKEKEEEMSQEEKKKQEKKEKDKVLTKK